jgi:hypothetical protein
MNKKIVQLILKGALDDISLSGIEILTESQLFLMKGGLKYANESCSNLGCTTTNSGCDNSACSGSAGNKNCTNISCAD